MKEAKATQFPVASAAGLPETTPPPSPPKTQKVAFKSKGGRFELIFIMQDRSTSAVLVVGQDQFTKAP
jgi:hypothetical protein